jgi:hypothetical protein
LPFVGIGFIKLKIPSKHRRDQYKDGLVSTGKRISHHNIKYIFYYPKNFLKEFY